MKPWLVVLVVLVIIALAASGVFSSRAPDPEPRPDPAASERSGTGVLTVTAVAPEGATGRVAFALYDSERGFKGEADPLESAFADLDETGRATWRHSALPYGVYAVKAYHDANGNEELDKGAFGMPTEAYGFSRNARGRFGPPSYEDTRFTMDAPDLVLEVRLSK